MYFSRRSGLPSRTRSHSVGIIVNAVLRQRANYSVSIKPAAFGRPEQAFSSLRRVPAATPAIGRSFHAWPNALRGIRPLLAVPLAAAVPFS